MKLISFLTSFLFLLLLLATTTEAKVPKIPTNKCKPHVVKNGYVILNQFPGKVHTVWCYANKPGDHGRGLALDLMVKNRSPEGRAIAEWTMNNAARLKVKYVIWGQRIWQKNVDKKAKPWTQWKKMGDRGSDTANHWDEKRFRQCWGYTRILTGIVWRMSCFICNGICDYNAGKTGLLEGFIFDAISSCKVLNV